MTDVAETASLLRDTCAIMRDLNLETGVIHRDLHAQNIVYDDETGTENESCHDANFAVIGGTHQWCQRWHHDNYQFSVIC